MITRFDPTGARVAHGDQPAETGIGFFQPIAYCIETGIRAGEAVDAASMADAISAVASWRPDTTRDACHRFASAQFAWDRVFDRYVAMYHELLAPAAAERSA